MKRFPALYLLGFLPVVYIPGVIMFWSGGAVIVTLFSISDGPDCGQPSDDDLTNVSKDALLWPWLLYRDAKRLAS